MVALILERMLGRLVAGDDADEPEEELLLMGWLVGASALPRFFRSCIASSLCPIRLCRLFLPGVNMAVRRSLSALRAALAWGVGALFSLRAEPGVPRRRELRRSRGAVRSRGV
jgi:hypothetical protein